jgi:sodium-dependent dicarboxylate transporter 2/3/5
MPTTLSNVLFLGGGREEIYRQLKALGKTSFEERMVLVVFTYTAFFWIIRSPVQCYVKKIVNDKEAYEQLFISRIDDTVIAILAGNVLFILPASKDKRRALLTWQEAVKLPWGILLLFGGELALAKGFKDSGLVKWLGEQMALSNGLSLFLLLLIIVAAINFLTEITSNLATTSMMLPILVLLAQGINVHPYLLTVGATVAASCAFMLPVATPPNAIVFGSGYLKIPDMVRAGIWMNGIWMNIISIILLALVTYYFLPFLWGFDANSFPGEWN